VQYPVGPENCPAWWLRDIYQTANGNYALCGGTTLPFDYSGIWLLETQPNGDIISNLAYPMEGEDIVAEGFTLIETDDADL